MRKSRWIQAAPVLLLLVARVAGAQDSAAQGGGEPGPFAEIVDVRVVNIEVVVTDRDGVPVRGLGASDFVLEVDGAEVPIAYFTEVRGGQALAGPAGGAMDLPAVPALVPGEPVGTSYLVFVDDYFTFEEDRNRVLDGLEADLGLLGANDRMAIVAFDGRQLEMLTSWTRSTPELERALRDARQRPTFGLQRLAELRQFERNVDTRPRGGAFGYDLDPETKAFILRLGDQIDRMLDGAAATLRSFGRPPGRKVMLLINGGWPYSPTEFVAGDARALTELDLVERDQLFNQVSDTANLLGYTLYPADASGLGARWAEDPASASRSEPGSSTLYLARTTGRQYSSRYLARETGGEALLYEDASRAFSSVVADTRSYYWLGFSPTRAWDDKEHKVEVRTRSRELKARSRQGFLDSSRRTEVTNSVESAFLFGSSGDSAELEIELGEWRRAGFRKMEMPMTVSMPLDAFTFVPYGEGVVAEVELRLAVEDEGLRRADIPVIPIRLEGRSQPGSGERWQYTVPLRLRRETHRALVALYDVASGRIFTSGVTIRP